MNSLSFYQDNTANTNQTWLPQTYFDSYFQDNAQTSFFDNIFQNSSFDMMTLFESQDIPKESSQPKAKQNSPNETSNPMVNSFADLVSQSSAFWTNKMNEHASKNLIVSTEGCKKESEVTDEDTTKSYKKAANKDTLIRVSQKQIKKMPKKENEKWQKKHDSRLLSLVKELGQDWIEIAGAFEESFVTPKYVEERYKVLYYKKSGLKSRDSIKQEDLKTTRPSSLHEEDCGSWTDFLSCAQPDYTKNQFCMMPFRENMQAKSSEMYQDFVGYEQLQPTREGSSQSYENTPVRSQDDIIDSYFNTDNFQELEHTLLENSHFLEKVDFSEGLEETNQRNNQFTSPVKVEEDDIGRKLWEEKPKEEVIEILSGRISLITSLYNQTWIELMKLQRERKSELNHM